MRMGRKDQETTAALRGAPPPSWDDGIAWDGWGPIPDELLPAEAAETVCLYEQPEDPRFPPIWRRIEVRRAP